LADALDSFESERATVNLSFGGVAGTESVPIVGGNALEYRGCRREHLGGTNLEQRRVG
jgi:hypothetical protein